MDTSSAIQGVHDYRRMSYPLFAMGGILLVVAYLIGITDNPPGIVSMLVGFFAAVLGIVFLLVKSGKRKPMQQVLYWTPRALCIVYALFISMFALDVFNEGNGFWGTALALMMHLIPTFLVLLMLVVCWRREWIGGILFIALGLLYVVWAWNKPFAAWSTLLLIAGPLVLTGSLFFLNWHHRSELRPDQ